MTYVGVAGGSISFGMMQVPTGCNANTTKGNSPGTQMVLGAVLPSPYTVSPAGDPISNSNLIVQSELVSTTPETVVYTLNPKAVWSDGVPITAKDRMGRAVMTPRTWYSPRSAVMPTSATLGAPECTSPPRSLIIPIAGTVPYICYAKALHLPC